MSADYYSLDPGAERLWCTTPEEAIAEYDCDDLDYPITVYAWRRKVLTADEIERYADDVIDALEDLISEDDWSDPEDTHRLEDAFRDALRVVVREHMPREHVWHCDRAPDLDVVIHAPEATP